MYEELSKMNMDAFDEITKSMIKDLDKDRKKGKGIKFHKIDQLIRKAQKKFDKQGYKNFRTLYKKYVILLKDDMETRLEGIKALFDNKDVVVPEPTNIIPDFNSTELFSTNVGFL